MLEAIKNDLGRELSLVEQKDLRDRFLFMIEMGSDGASADEVKRRSQQGLAAAIAASLATDGPPTVTPSAAMAALPPQPPLPAPPQYMGEKAQLQAMGFADDVANQTALEAANGDVQRALEMLLG